LAFRSKSGCGSICGDFLTSWSKAVRGTRTRAAFPVCPLLAVVLTAVAGVATYAAIFGKDAGIAMPLFPQKALSGDG